VINCCYNIGHSSLHLTIVQAKSNLKPWNTLKKWRKESSLVANYSNQIMTPAEARIQVGLWRSVMPLTCQATTFQDSPLKNKLIKQLYNFRLDNKVMYPCQSSNRSPRSRRTKSSCNASSQNQKIFIRSIPLWKQSTIINIQI
jgi:hypothetical protein